MSNIILPSSLDYLTFSNLEDGEYHLPTRHEILPGLWLGQDPDGKVPKEFKYIISVNGAKYINLLNRYTISTFFEDSYVVPPEHYLNSLADLILRCWKDGQTLVHCAAGQNRSALVLGLALVRNGMKSSDAIELMRAKRSRLVLHNKVFENWLLAK